MHGIVAGDRTGSCFSAPVRLAPVKQIVFVVGNRRRGTNDDRPCWLIGKKAFWPNRRNIVNPSDIGDESISDNRHPVAVNHFALKLYVPALPLVSISCLQIVQRDGASRAEISIWQVPRDGRKERFHYERQGSCVKPAAQGEGSPAPTISVV